MIEKRIFEKNTGKKVRIGLTPNNFTLVGIIDYVFEDCLQFTTEQRTSWLDFDAIMSICELED